MVIYSYAPGSVIQLKSGGHKMTVIENNSDVLTCVWSDRGQIREKKLPVDAIRMHDPFDRVADLIIEGVTHSKSEIARLRKERGNA